jgi:hypothetical protein
MSYVPTELTHNDMYAFSHYILHREDHDLVF